MDEVRLWSSALRSSAIADHAAGTCISDSGAPAASLYAHWVFDGAQMRDLAPGGRHLSVEKGAASDSSVASALPPPARARACPVPCAASSRNLALGRPATSALVGAWTMARATPSRGGRTTDLATGTPTSTIPLGQATRRNPRSADLERSDASDRDLYARSCV